MTQAPQETQSRRQVLYWRLLTTIFEQRDKTPSFDDMADAIIDDLGLPELVSDPHVAIDTLIQRYPELDGAFDDLIPGQQTEDQPAEDAGQADTDDELDDETLRRAALFSKVLINVFGPNARRPVISAQNYSQWCQDVGHFERACGRSPGGLRHKAGGHGNQPQAGRGPGISEEALRRDLEHMESGLIERMELREVLKDRELADKITPSMPVVEQLLRDKSNLSDQALANAKRIIKRYVDKLAEVLKLAVAQTKTGKTDSSVPPKRVFRNLDLDRTVWKNLINWDPGDQKLYVDQLYFKRTAETKRPSRLIVVVDQSGSMVDAMVNCTILASIFSGLPNVDPHLLAYDTRAIDLSKWVADPFEVLLRTELGGGTEGMVVMPKVEQKISDPQNTAVIWISDFYDWDNQRLFERLEAMHDSGVHLIPVGSVTSSGYYSVNAWFKQRFKQLGTPLISGNIETLIREIKGFVG